MDDIIILWPDFNSRPHGGRPSGAWLVTHSGGISTHALTEGDAAILVSIDTSSPFQLTPSRRATLIVSISDTVLLFQLTPSRRATRIRQVPQTTDIYFNSRPHGGRLRRSNSSCSSFVFQLTPSRRATYVCLTVRFHGRISTHALTEGDSLQLESSALPEYFNSRPHGGRLFPDLASSPGHISTHALTEGDNFLFHLFSIDSYISTHALTEGDLLVRSFFLP